MSQQCADRLTQHCFSLRRLDTQNRCGAVALRPSRALDQSLSFSRQTGIEAELALGRPSDSA